MLAAKQGRLPQVRPNRSCRPAPSLGGRNYARMVGSYSLVSSSKLPVGSTGGTPRASPKAPGLVPEGFLGKYPVCIAPVGYIELVYPMPGGVCRPFRYRNGVSVGLSLHCLGQPLVWGHFLQDNCPYSACADLKSSLFKGRPSENFGGRGVQPFGGG
jgi:hypothetical protein